MSNTNIFMNSTKSLPKSDAQIIRVSMEENEIAGRKTMVPSTPMGGGMAIQHVPSAGGKN